MHRFYAKIMKRGVQSTGGHPPKSAPGINRILTYYVSFIVQDGELTKSEILDHQDVFVGSQATDFGEALTRVYHDEF